MPPHARGRRQEKLPFVLCACAAFFVTALIYTASGGGAHVGDELPSEAHGLSLEQLSVRAANNGTGVCTMDRPFHFRSNNAAWLLLLIPIILFAFAGLAVVTDDYFVPSLELLCKRLRLTEDVAGATFLAAGSSAPELFTGILGTFHTKNDVGVGTILGSAAFNVLVTIGLSAALCPGSPRLDWRPFMRDATFYVLAVVLLLLVTVLSGQPGEIQWWEALMLVILYAIYVAFMWFFNERYMNATAKYVAGCDAPQPQDIEEPTPPPAASPRLGPRSDSPFNEDGGMDLDHFGSGRDSMDGLDLEEETHRVFERPHSASGWCIVPLVVPWRLAFWLTVPDVRKRRLAKYWPLTFAICIVWIMLLTFILVQAATPAGCFLRIPSAIMGLLVLSAGASLADLLSSVAVAKKGYADMAVSNAIGSNVFDILMGLGMPWLIGAIIYGKPIQVAQGDTSVLIVPMVILLALMAALIAVLSLTGWRMSKVLGYSLFGLYGVFVVYVLVDHFVI